MPQILQSINTIHRADFLVAYTIILLFPAILARASLLDSLIVIGFILFAFAFGNTVNSYSDAKGDRLNPRKRHIAKALLQIKFLKPLLFAEFVIIIIGSLVLFCSKPLVLILGGLIAFFALGYSLEPLRFKRRGILHGFSLSLSVYILPVLFVYFALAKEINWTFVGLLVMYAIFRSGVSFINNIDDYFEDKKAGIKTTAVALGVKKTAEIGFVLSALGIIGLVFFLLKMNVFLIFIGVLLFVGLLVLLSERKVYKSAEKGTALGVKASQEFFARPKLVNAFDIIFLIICFLLRLVG